MMASAECRLHGFVNPIGLVPAFVIPVFTGDRSNYLFAQQIGADDRIIDFHPLDLGSHDLNPTVVETRVEIGSEALWGFQYSAEQSTVGTRDQILQVLETLDLRETPALDLQAARFGGKNVLPAMGRCYRHLLSHSAASAQSWRDLTILTPEFRQRLAVQLAPRSLARRDLQSLIVRSDEDRIRVHLSERLLEALGGEKKLRAELQVHEDLLDCLDVRAVEIEESPSFEGVADSDKRERQLQDVSFIAIGSSAGNVASSAAKSAGVKFIPPDRLFGEDGRLKSGKSHHPDSIFVLIAEDDQESLAHALRLAKRLVGRHARVAVIILRSAHLTPRPKKDRNIEVLDKGFDELARASHWIATIGGPGLRRGARTGPIAGADPLNNSPSHLLKWTAHALAEAGRRHEGGAFLDLVFKVRRTPKLADIGVGASSASDAATLAAEAAFICLAKASPALARTQALGIAIFRGPRARSDTRLQVQQVVHQRAPATESSILEIVRPGMGTQVRVIIVARGTLGESDKWRGTSELNEFDENGWRYGHHLPEIDVLDVLISKGEAQYALRTEPVRKLRSFEEADDIITSTPMYRGPVALLLNEMPGPDIVSYLLTAGVFCVERGKVEQLDAYGQRPFAALRSEILMLPRDEAGHRLRFLIRDLLWSELSHKHGFDFGTRWLHESDPEQIRIDNLDLYRVTPKGEAFLRGHGIAAPNKHQKGDDVDFSFWLVLDEDGIRVTRTARE